MSRVIESKMLARKNLEGILNSNFLDNKMLALIFKLIISFEIWTLFVVRMSALFKHYNYLILKDI